MVGGSRMWLSAEITRYSTCDSFAHQVVRQSLMAVNVETTFCTSCVPHVGHAGGAASSWSRSLIGRFTSNSSPQARHLKAYVATAARSSRSPSLEGI